jgi:hypothetical protein
MLRIQLTKRANQMTYFFAFVLAFLSLPLTAQISIYDPFDSNSNQWIVCKNDTATFTVELSKLNMETHVYGNYVNAKGAPFDQKKSYRVEAGSTFVTGADSLKYGICWGASDMGTYLVYYITPAGKYGFGKISNHIWADIVPLSPSPFIQSKGTNWLRISTATTEGKATISLCINEVIVKTIDYIQPPGDFFGTYIGGKGHVLFDDFILYQKDPNAPEFEPCDLTLSAYCRSSQLRYTGNLLDWSACVPAGCRAEEDSVVTRFWFMDERAGTYAVLVVPFDAAGDGEFFNAAQRDFLEYIRDTTDPVIPKTADKPIKTAIGNETEVVVLGQLYGADELSGNMYIRRYYVHHDFSDHNGLLFQFIVPENSSYAAIDDELIRLIIASLEFAK